jgi:diguanylate cyclase (GGDEF)-like protein/PAS domain S-box-containing protein
VIQALMSNLAVLAAFLFFSSHFFNRKPTARHSPFNSKLKLGLIHGLFGIILMFFGLDIASNTFIDFRQIMIIVSAYFGGIYAALATGLIISIGRIALFGGFNPSSLATVVISLLTALLCGFMFRNLHTFWWAWLSSTLGSIAITGTAFYLLLQAQKYEVIAIYLPMFVISSVFTAYLIRFLNKSNHLMVQLQLSEDRYRNLFTMYDAILHAANDVAIIATNAEGTIQLFNTGAQKLFGYKPDDLINKHTLMILHQPPEVEERSEQLSRMFKRPIQGFDVVVEFAKQTDSQSQEWTYVRKDGSLLAVNMIVSAIKDHDRQITGFVGIGTDITEKKEAEEKLLEANRILHQLSMIDGLTEIANRRSFEEALDREWKRAERTGGSLSLIMFDIDFFKLYNDTYGHQGGDLCLKRVALLAKQSLFRKPDLVARYGGEEFAVILPDTKAEDATLIAERIRAAIESDAIQHSGSKASSVVTVSVGVTTMMPDPHIDKNELIIGADKALYQAKQNGRNQVRSFS